MSKDFKTKIHYKVQKRIIYPQKMKRERERERERVITFLGGKNMDLIKNLYKLGIPPLIDSPINLYKLLKVFHPFCERPGFLGALN